MSTSGTSTPLHALLVIRTPDLKAAAKKSIETTYGSLIQLEEIDLLQDALEHLEKRSAKRNLSPYSLILFEHNSPSLTLAKAFLGLEPRSNYILCSSDQLAAAPLLNMPNPPEFILSSDLDGGIHRALKKLSAIGKIPPLPVLDEDQYVAMSPDTIVGMSPLKYDVYVRMATGRYVCLFKIGTSLLAADLQKYKDNHIDFFYIKKTDSDQILAAEAVALEKLSNKAEVSLPEAKKQFSASFNVVRDVVNQVGFTPQAQAIAKSSVAMSLKALGSKPKLSAILTELKKKEGDYIVSHSFMLGQVACALAYKVGWHSAATFFKLSLAAFLHDISLNNTELAQESSYEEAKESGRWTHDQLNQLKLHPSKAAEYSKQFSEIPSDVDQIIIQHHERADGSGFPRQINGKSISPLTALFIMSHDLVHAVFENPNTNVDQYFEQHADRYQIGQFKKVILALKNPPETKES